MSLKFISFDAMTKQNKVTALMQILDEKEKKQLDYLSALYALTDSDMSVYLAAKRVIKTFLSEPYAIDFTGKSRNESKEIVLDYILKNVGVKPNLIEFESHSGVRMLTKELHMKQETYEATGKWIGPFGKDLCLLNALRDDTQGIINQIVNSDETVRKAYLCFYDPDLINFRQGKQSLDTTGAAFKTELSSVRTPGEISATLGSLFEKVVSPTYLLLLFTDKKGYLLLREDLRESKAAVFIFNLAFVSNIKLSEFDGLSTIELETPFDNLKFPYLNTEDARDAIEFINTIKQPKQGSKTNSLSTSNKQILSILEREFNKLDSLFSSKYMDGKTFLSHKIDLQIKDLNELIHNEENSFSGGLIKEEPIEKTVLYVDIIGFTGGPAEKHPLKVSTLKPVHMKILFPVIKENNGQIIKKAGDSIISIFDSNNNACLAAKTIFSKINNFNQSKSEKIFVRTSISREELFVSNNKHRGNALNIAIGMIPLTSFGKIYMTKKAYGGLSDGFSEIGSFNIPHYKNKINIIQIMENENLMSNTADMYLNALDMHFGIQQDSSKLKSKCIKAISNNLEETIRAYKKAVASGYLKNINIEKKLAELRALLKEI